MSDSHKKLPKLFWIQLALAAIIGIIFLTTPSKHSGDTESADTAKAASKNLEPVGAVSTKDAQASSGSTKARSGEEVYKASCMACHATGVANAPNPDDKAAWKPRVATGLDALMKTAINGKGAMPARGGNPAITDEEIKATILYMTKKAGFDLTAKQEEKTPKTTSAPVAEKKEEPIQKMTETATTTEAVSAPTPPSAPTAPSAPDDMLAETTQKMEEVAAVTAAAAPNNAEGKKVYKGACFACHDAGVAGSPKIGDKKAWASRIATGNEALYTSAIKGKGVMPAKGGNTGLSDEAVKAAVNYMVAESQ